MNERMPSAAQVAWERMRMLTGIDPDDVVRTTQSIDTLCAAAELASDDPELLCQLVGHRCASPELIKHAVAQSHGPGMAEKAAYNTACPEKLALELLREVPVPDGGWRTWGLSPLPAGVISVLAPSIDWRGRMKPADILSLTQHGRRLADEQPSKFVAQWLADRTGASAANLSGRHTALIARRTDLSDSEWVECAWTLWSSELRNMTRDWVRETPRSDTAEIALFDRMMIALGDDPITYAYLLIFGTLLASNRPAVVRHMVAEWARTGRLEHLLVDVIEESDALRHTRDQLADFVRATSSIRHKKAAEHVLLGHRDECVSYLTSRRRYAPREMDHLTATQLDAIAQLGATWEGTWGELIDLVRTLP